MALDEINSMTTVAFAELYFESKVDPEAWECTEDIDGGLTATEQKLRALIDATRRMTELRYRGCRTDSDQLHPFPRGGDTVVPIPIQNAVCELAYALLDGINDELEVGNASLTSQSFSGIKTTYNSDSTPLHVMAGVPSIQAWRYLTPFLRDALSVRIVRV